MVDDGETRASCPQCGRAIDATEPTSDGVAVCPQCAHSVASLASEHSTELLLPDDLVGESDERRFRLAGILGEGGFGTVYRAFDRTLRRTVAIKVPKKVGPQVDARQFVLEARAASALRHPNVVTIYDIGFNDDVPFIVSECVEGVSLRQWLDGPQASFENVARLAEKLCRAIGYAHAMGVVHRDIKPSNVIVDDSNEPHVLDFGLSSSRLTGDVVKVRSNVPVGTPAYMAPEQAIGDVDRIGRSTDVYALGVVLYQMISRRLPFVGSAARILELVVYEEPLRPRSLDPRIPVGLEAIALKAMSKESSRRYSSADAMAEDLKRYREGRRVNALGRHDRRSLVMTARRRFVFAVAAASSVGLLGVGGSLGFSAFADDPRVRVRLADNASSETVVWIPLDELEGRLLYDRATTGQGDDEFRLAPGLYRVIVRRGADAADVYRTVPAPGEVEVADVSRDLTLRWRHWTEESAIFGNRFLLPHVKVAANVAGDAMQGIVGGSVRFPEGPGLPLGLAGKTQRLPDFFIDKQPSSVQQVSNELGTVFERRGFNVGRARTGTASIPFGYGLEFAERRGLSLMSVWEWVHVATNGGRTAYPWGDELPVSAAWDDLPSVDRCLLYPEVVGLFSGLGEWTSTPMPMPAEQVDAMRKSRTALVPKRAVVGYAPGAYGRGRAGITHKHVHSLAFRPRDEEYSPSVRCVARPIGDAQAAFL